MLRVEIATPDHYRPPRDKTKGQVQHLITLQEKLPSTGLLHYNYSISKEEVIQRGMKKVRV